MEAPENAAPPFGRTFRSIAVAPLARADEIPKMKTLADRGIKLTQEDKEGLVFWTSEGDGTRDVPPFTFLLNSRQ
jgi:hypothetical protein